MPLLNLTSCINIKLKLRNTFNRTQGCNQTPMQFNFVNKNDNIAFAQLRLHSN